MKFVVIAGVASILIIAVVWYFSQHGMKKGEARVNPNDGLKYVWILPGTFIMGRSPGNAEYYDFEEPSHEVTIARGFRLGQTEVTVGAYKRFAGATRPVETLALDVFNQLAYTLLLDFLPQCRG